MAKTEILEALIETVHRLRAPGGCPWDREQTHRSLRPYLIEEAYEVLEVLDQIETSSDLKKESIQAAFKEELGDLFMQVLLHSEMTAEEKAFDIYDVAETLNEKLIRRHPHVFGETQVENAEQAYQNWEKQKAKEKAKKPKSSVIEGLPKGLPALQRAGRVLEKVTKVGFQWSDFEGPLAKVEEEWGELKEEIQNFEKGKGSKERIEDELGDLIFTVANLAFLMKIEPENALRKTLQRFENRFRFVENKLKENGKLPEDSNLEEMDRYWNEAKKQEKK